MPYNFKQIINLSFRFYLRRVPQTHNSLNSKTAITCKSQLYHFYEIPMVYCTTTNAYLGKFIINIKQGTILICAKRISPLCCIDHCVYIMFKLPITRPSLLEIIYKHSQLCFTNDSSGISKCVCILLCSYLCSFELLFLKRSLYHICWNAHSMKDINLHKYLLLKNILHTRTPKF